LVPLESTLFIAPKSNLKERWQLRTGELPLGEAWGVQIVLYEPFKEITENASQGPESYGGST